MNRKGQAAMEFLMTYGWAILVVIAAIAVLAASGLLDFSKILPEKCTFPAGMDCNDVPSIHSNGSIVLSLRNNVGFSINVTSISMLDSDGLPDCTGTPQVDTLDPTPPTFEPLPSATIRQGDVFLVLFETCGVGTVGDKYSGTATINYFNQESKLTGSKVGDVSGRVS